MIPKHRTGSEVLSEQQALVKLDIDSKNAPDLRTLVQKCHRASVAINWLSQQRSPSGKGWHLVLSVSPRPRTAMEVVALQAVLGGDVWREATQITRARNWTKAPAFMRSMWNVLYRADRRRARNLNLGV